MPINIFVKGFFRFQKNYALNIKHLIQIYMSWSGKKWTTLAVMLIV